MTGEDRVLGRGAHGDEVLDVQVRLTAVGFPAPDAEWGSYGPGTTRAVAAFQSRRGLASTGEVDGVTWRELVEAGRRLGSRLLYRRLPYMRGDDVRDLQHRLNALGFDAGTEDGIYGKATYDAVREFQRNMGLPVDGIVGRDTVDALARLARAIRPGSKAHLRQRLAREDGGQSGRLVYLDPGHGGRDPGVVSSSGVPEASVTFRVGETAATALSVLGFRTALSRGIQQGPDAERRARGANETSPDVAVSVHAGCSREQAPFVAAYACNGRESPLGHDLGALVASAVGGVVGHTLPLLGRNLDFLRMTAMPAIVVDVGGPDADRMLADDAFVSALGEALASAVAGYFCAPGRTHAARQG